MITYNSRNQLIFVFALFVIMTIGITSFGNADVQTSSLSGLIIDLNGEPVTDATVILLAVEIDIFRRTIDPIYDNKTYPFHILNHPPSNVRKNRVVKLRVKVHLILKLYLILKVSSHLET